MPTLDFLTDPAAFLAAVGERLAEQPVVSTVVATVAARAAAECADGVEQDPRNWYVVVRDEGGRVVGAGMRTAPFEPRPLYVLPMPGPAALTLARALHERAKPVTGVNGALPAARTLAHELARLTDRAVAVAQHTRLFELGTLVRPPVPAGTMRSAAPDDVDLCLAWFTEFAVDADEQAGRAAGTHHELGEDRDTMLRRISARRMALWEVDGEVVHLTAANPPAFGVARIGPVYTPKGHRGRGYASATVAGVSQRILDEGARPCLFTDQANPTSNAIYQRLGYESLVDMVNLVLVSPDHVAPGGTPRTV